jgi:hypothetical protein
MKCLQELRRRSVLGSGYLQLADACGLGSEVYSLAQSVTCQQFYIHLRAGKSQATEGCRTSDTRIPHTLTNKAPHGFSSKLNTCTSGQETPRLPAPHSKKLHKHTTNSPLTMQLKFPPTQGQFCQEGLHLSLQTYRSTFQTVRRFGRNYWFFHKYESNLKLSLPNYTVSHCTVTLTDWGSTRPACSARSTGRSIIHAVHRMINVYRRCFSSAC